MIGLEATLWGTRREIGCEPRKRLALMEAWRLGDRELRPQIMWFSSCDGKGRDARFRQISCRRTSSQPGPTQSVRWLYTIQRFGATNPVSPQSYAGMFVFRSLGYLGYLDQARFRRDAELELARKQAHAHTLAMLLGVFLAIRHAYPARCRELAVKFGAPGNTKR